MIDFTLASQLETQRATSDKNMQSFLREPVDVAEEPPNKSNTFKALLS